MTEGARAHFSHTSRRGEFWAGQSPLLPSCMDTRRTKTIQGCPYGEHESQPSLHSLTNVSRDVRRRRKSIEGVSERQKRGENNCEACKTMRATRFSRMETTPNKLVFLQLASFVSSEMGGKYYATWCHLRENMKSEKSQVLLREDGGRVSEAVVCDRERYNREGNYNVVQRVFFCNSNCHKYHGCRRICTTRKLEYRFSFIRNQSAMRIWLHRS